MSARLRRDGGFSLPELLVTLTIAMTVSLAAFALVEFVMKRAAETEQRVDASQRGRVALETITRQLRSQVCLTKGNTSSPPIVSGTGNTIRFYTDLSDASSTAPYPEMHDLTYNATAKTIVEQDWTTNDGNTWILKSTRTLLTDVKPELKDDGSAEDVFRYYGYTYDAARTPALALMQYSPLAGNAGRVVKLRVSFRAAPRTKGTRSDVEVPFHDDVFVRAVDPNELSTGSANLAPIPTCA